MLRFFICSFLLCSLAQATSLDIQFKEITAEPLNKTSALKMEDLKGKVVLVDFWASWCEPCKEALPHYEKLYQKYKGKGLVILGINEDDDMKDRDAFLKAHPLSFPVFFDKEKKMANAFGVAALPTLFVFDKNLKATDLFRGFDEKKTASLEKKISTLLSEKK